MNFFRKWLFFQGLIRSTQEKNEAFDLQIELYSEILIRDEARKVEMAEIIEGNKGKKEKDKKKIEFKVLGKTAEQRMLGSISDYRLAITENRNMIGLIKKRMKRFIIF